MTLNRETATLAHAVLNRDGSRAWNSSNGPVASSRTSFPTGTSRRSSSKSAGKTSKSYTSRPAGSPRSCPPVQGVRDVEVSLENDYPEIHVHTEREAAGLVGVTSRSAAQTTLDATLGNIDTPSLWIDPHNGQSYCVFTYYDGPRCRTRARPPHLLTSAQRGSSRPSPMAAVALRIARIVRPIRCSARRPRTGRAARGPLRSRALDRPRMPARTFEPSLSSGSHRRLHRAVRGPESLALCPLQ